MNSPTHYVVYRILRRAVAACIKSSNGEPLRYSCLINLPISVIF